METLFKIKARVEVYGKSIHEYPQKVQHSRRRIGEESTLQSFTGGTDFWMEEKEERGMVNGDLIGSVPILADVLWQERT